MRILDWNGASSAEQCEALRRPALEDAAGVNATARDIIERQLNHLVRLVDDLLDVERLARGRIELRKHPIEIAAVIAAAVETSRPALDARGHQLDISIPKEPIFVDGDLTRLRQVLANLLDNAGKYSPPASVIRPAPSAA